ncbi:MAG TPA: alpha-hydroxy-acid oxidizing protein, partial [Terriglobia bacterium]|nr:alpha-hydroxy-acid oxidizing protein [Terriglobia bacterium]
MNTTTETGRGTIECVSEVVQGVRGRIPVIVDGGFRRGTDIYKALALGATAAGIGRPYIPAMQEAIKGSTAKFTAEELITKREQVRDDIKNQLRTKLKEHDILVDEFNIVNFEFSKIFNEAIEAKVTAEQQALAAKNKLEQ